MPYVFRHSICNEAFDKWPFAEACKAIRKAGYTASRSRRSRWPKTRPTITAAAARASTATSCGPKGLAFVGLHWLMVSPKGLHVTTPG